MRRYLLLFFILFLCLFSCNNNSSEDFENFMEYKDGYTLDPVILPSNSMSFIALGDFGRGDTGQNAVADQMETYHLSYAQDFVLFLGDNFYDEGVTGTDDPLFDLYFRDIYDNAVLDIPFYVVLGNHDHYGNAKAQIDYIDPDGRWIFPSLFYNFSCVLNDGTEIEFFMIDTQVITESYPVSCYELAWLTDVLSESTADYKIAAAHHPIYSSGYHGSSPLLEARIGALFTQYGVDIYLSGHDHHLEIFNELNGYIQIISGAGSDGLRPVDPGPDTLWGDSVLGFVSIDIDADGITVHIIQSDGTEMFTGNY